MDSPLALPMPVSALQAVSLVAGLAWLPLSDRLSGWPAALTKGSAVGLLAAAALLLGVRHARWLALVLGLGALGDVLLERSGGLALGMTAFAAGHAVAIRLWQAHPGRQPRFRRWLAAPLLGAGLLVPLLLDTPGIAPWRTTVYALLLAGMAASLAASALPGIAVVGALLFVASDVLLGLRAGGRIVGSAGLHGALVWCGYYAGQALIFAGAARHLARCRRR